MCMCENIRKFYHFLRESDESDGSVVGEIDEYMIVPIAIILVSIKL